LLHLVQTSSNLDLALATYRVGSDGEVCSLSTLDAEYRRRGKVYLFRSLGDKRQLELWETYQCSSYNKTCKPQ
jgi:hypothetical protein